jgi:hypothetical protein
MVSTTVVTCFGCLVLTTHCFATQDYAVRVCREAHEGTLANGKGCSRERCEEETRLRCPFRNLIRGHSNRRIRDVAKQFKIWEERAASDWCTNWYGRELANLTHVAAVWDALHLMPCFADEDAARFSKCFVLETDGISATHPMAKVIYMAV